MSEQARMMSLKDRLYLHPLDKYEKYGRYPWALAVQLLIVLMTTCQALLIVNRNTSYSYDQYQLFNKLFLNLDVQGSDKDIQNEFTIYHIQELNTYIQQTVHKYSDINSYTIDEYSYEYEDDGDKEPATLLVSYIGHNWKDKGYKNIYDLTEEDLGPFSHYNTRKYLSDVERFEIEFHLIHHLNSNMDVSSNCYHWKIVQFYDFHNHGSIHVSLKTTRTTCSSKEFNIFENYLWIGAMVFLLGCFSLGIVCTYLLKRAMIMAHIKKGHEMDTWNAWESLRFREKIKFINLWVIFTVIGNLAQIFAGILTLIDQDTVLQVHEQIIGIACFCAWVGLVRFIEHSSNSYIIVNTLKRSFGKILPYLVGILPIFMAYVFLGMCMFWKTGLYPNTTAGMVTNFAILNGDSVYGFFASCVADNSVFGQLYMFTFIVFFICCVHNIFIAIIQEGFASLNERPVRKHRVESSESDSDDTPLLPPPLKASAEEQKKSDFGKKYLAQKSRMALKMILKGTKKESSVLDENTQKAIGRIISSGKDIDRILQKMQMMATPQQGVSMDRDEIVRQLVITLNEQKETINNILANL